MRTESSSIGASSLIGRPLCGNSCLALKVGPSRADRAHIDSDSAHTPAATADPARTSAEKARARARRLKTPVKAAAFTALACALALAGAWLALRAFSEQTVSTEFAQVHTQTHLAREGSLSLNVPVVNWGVKTPAKGLPMALEAQIDKVDRERAATAIGPDPDAPKRSLATIKKDSRHVVEATIRRALVCIIIGCLGGGLMAGALMGALLHRRTLIIWGAAAGMVLPLSMAPSTISAIRDLRSDKVSAATVDFTGQGAELARVVAFAEQLLFVKDDYSVLYTRALGSAKNVLGFATRGQPKLQRGQRETSVLVASDLHDNILVTDSFDAFAGKRTVFMAGDFGQVGAKVESELADDIAGLGGRVVAVSGNHDSEDFMVSLAKAGATVLTSKGTLQADGTVNSAQVLITVDGLRVAGYTDPLQRKAGYNDDHVLRVYGDAYEAQAGDLIKWFDALPERPDVLMVHQHGLAHRLMSHIARQGDQRKLVIITGHDHKAHVEKDGPRLLVDGGSLGAGGPFAVGEQPSAFAQLRVLTGGEGDPTVAAADLVAIDPISGTSSARHIELAGQDKRTWYADESVQLAGRPLAH